MSKIVLQKYIAESGFCSRRKAEALIKGGKVRVNDKPAELGMRVDEDDEIIVSGKKISIIEEKIYIIINKPVGVTCTNREFKSEKNIFSLLPKALNIKYKLHAVGRLDKNSRGLVLLTNDGDLTERLTHPRYEYKKTYQVTVKAHFSRSESKQGAFFNETQIMSRLLNGIDIGDGDGIVKAKYMKQIGVNKFEIILTEGKKRQIRRMFKEVGCDTVDLVKTRIGKLKLGDLKEGKIKQIKKIDII